MKKETLIKKLKTHISVLEDTLEDMASLLEVDGDDESLAEMWAILREQIEKALYDNDECTYTDIVEYIEENL